MSYTAKITKIDYPATRREESKFFLVTGGRDEKALEVWHYVRIPLAKLAGFKEAISAGKISFKEFGEILISGYGTPPSEDELHKRVPI